MNYGGREALVASELTVLHWDSGLIGNAEHIGCTQCVINAAWEAHSSLKAQVCAGGEIGHQHSTVSGAGCCCIGGTLARITHERPKANNDAGAHADLSRKEEGDGVFDIMHQADVERIAIAHIEDHVRRRCWRR